MRRRGHGRAERWLEGSVRPPAVSSEATTKASGPVAGAAGQAQVEEIAVRKSRGAAAKVTFVYLSPGEMGSFGAVGRFWLSCLDSRLQRCSFLR